MERANKDQYALLFGWVYPYILQRLGYVVNHTHIQQIHEEFKQYLGYESISGVSQGIVQKFIMEVMGTSSMEFGIYVPDPDQPTNAEDLPLEILWNK